MLTLNWSFLNLLGYSGGPTSQVLVNFLFFIPLSGEKQQVEMKLRIIASLVGLVLLITYEIVDTVVPRRDLREFRTAYLGQQKEEWRNDPDNKIPDDVRINIMHVRRPWYTLFMGKFYWTWNDGFIPPQQKDANMKLLTFQGVAGSAFKAKKPKAVDLRNLSPQMVSLMDYKAQITLAVVAGVLSTVPWWLIGKPSPIPYFIGVIIALAVYLSFSVLRTNVFRLWPWQLKKTEDVKYILSIPLFKASKGESKSFKCTGVINLDTLSDEGAEFLERNEGKIVNYFLDRGKVIACLR
jgi:hypothetical protein